MPVSLFFGELSVLLHTAPQAIIAEHGQLVDVQANSLLANSSSSTINVTPAGELQQAYAMSGQ